jgi:PIN domain nuclease of toxin-antitoxin system
MKCLLDTHALIWMAHDSEKLSLKATECVLNSSNELYLSVASIWEMSIKASIGRLSFQDSLSDIVDQQVSLNGLNILSIETSHALKVENLSWHHRDPFDRLLIAQCHQEGMTLISCDRIMDEYDIPRLW